MSENIATKKCNKMPRLAFYMKFKLARYLDDDILFWRGSRKRYDAVEFLRAAYGMPSIMNTEGH